MNQFNHPSITRRELLTAAAWAALPTSTQTLRDVGASKGLLVGTAVSYRELQRPEFTDLLARQAAIVVAENEMKWQTIHPELDRYDFARGDALIEFALAHRQRVRGHNLCWHRQLPGWFKTQANSTNALNLLTAHIKAVLAHYNGRMHSWDVVNEAIDVKDGHSDGLRKSPWLELAGPGYIDTAFRTARAADGKTLLTYNDFDLEQDSASHEVKRKAVIKLLSGMRERDVPIDAVGLQAHLKATTAPSHWEGFQNFVSELEKLKLQIFITELDVDDSALPAEIPRRDQLVAQLYHDFLSQALRHKSVTAILTWGLTDADSWLKSFSPREDKLPPRPLPFDANLQPKPAYTSMLDCIANRVA